MMLRLGTIEPELCKAIRQCSRHTRRKVVLATVENAIESSETKEAPVRDVLAQLNAHQPVPKPSVGHLERIRDALDEAYFASQECTPGDQAEYLKLFSQARALSAVIYACHDTLQDDCESLYEAFMSLEDRLPSVTTIWGYLAGIRPGDG